MLVALAGQSEKGEHLDVMVERGEGGRGGGGLVLTYSILMGLKTIKVELNWSVGLKISSSVETEKVWSFCSKQYNCFT